MDVAQALDCAHAIALPGFFVDEQEMIRNRQRNEAAIAVLLDAWRTAELGARADELQGLSPKIVEPFSFEAARTLADRNRDLCDSYGIQRLRTMRPTTLSRSLSNPDLIRGCAALQSRDVSIVAQSAGRDARELNVAYTEAPVKAMVCGVDIETTDIDPSRGYIINLGIEFAVFGDTLKIENPFAAYFGLPQMYEEKGVPLTEIHKISWTDLDGKIAFREDKKLQEALLSSFKMFPYMAHNASFEDSWFMLHLDGYAEARLNGEIVPIDTRDICRRIDPEVRSLPRESSPASLQSWARRRGTLAADELERHLGLDDVDLMFKTVYEEFKERQML